LEEDNDMRKTIISIGALAFVTALGAAPVFAQNMQGPGAENYNAGSGPQTGGKLTTEPATPQGQQGRTTQGRGLYNSAGQPTNPAGSAPRGNKSGMAKSNSIKH
jgi:hypothetical protein